MNLCRMKIQFLLFLLALGNATEDRIDLHLTGNLTCQDPFSRSSFSQTWCARMILMENDAMWVYLEILWKPLFRQKNQNFQFWMGYCCARSTQLPNFPKIFEFDCHIRVPREISSRIDGFWGSLASIWILRGTVARCLRTKHRISRQLF